MTDQTQPEPHDSTPHRLACISCNAEKRLSEPGGPNQWPMTDDGVVFHGAGNYGSAVYDPMDGTYEYLRIIVCDDCMKKKAGRIEHIHYETPRTTGRARSFAETLVKEGQLGATQDALYRLADQADSG